MNSKITVEDAVGRIKVVDISGCKGSMNLDEVEAFIESLSELEHELKKGNSDSKIVINFSGQWSDWKLSRRMFANKSIL